ncbi:MAG: DPP IV N-terminal domain-containing protein, partial [Bacteroidetes bacterium]|nr:DPP IV N-terminal domain-containing protein [Bacteroidota bacterium]
MSFNSNKLSLTVILTLLSISIHLVGFAQDKKLTFDQVYLFGQPQMLDRLPSLKGWFDENHYLQTKKENDKTFIMKVNAYSGEEDIYVDYAVINENLKNGLDASKSVDVTNDYNDFLFTKDNDLYYYSVHRNEFKRLTQDEAKENNPTLSPDGKKVVFTKGHNLFVVDIESGEVTQLTFDGTDDIYNGWASWV